MLADVKTALRLSQNVTALDGEVEDLIAAARDDLRLSGILPAKVADDTDSLIKRAVVTYCKANFGFDNPDAARLQASYESLKAHLSMSIEYTMEGDA
ncbi:DNA-packaging protein [Paenibacillus thailandensis]|uniref:DNA-packaging protein n=1 Tax=Paenibacillus thailandensis TaxID=393250 RepID=A0ABW5QT63_9BACL